VAEARCALSDLPVGQRACRVHGPQPEPPVPAGVRTTARYPGHCEGCSERIRVGDTIVRMAVWAVQHPVHQRAGQPYRGLRHTWITTRQETR
jgi:hypothetical protein